MLAIDLAKHAGLNHLEIIYPIQESVQNKILIDIIAIFSRIAFVRKRFRKPYITCPNPYLYEVGMFLEIRKSVVAFERTTQTSEPSVYAELPILVVIEWMALYIIAYNKPTYICVRPVENRQNNVHMIGFAPIGSSNNRLFVIGCPFRAFGTSDALNRGVQYLVLF